MAREMVTSADIISAGKELVEKEWHDSITMAEVADFVLDVLHTFEKHPLTHQQRHDQPIRPPRDTMVRKWFDGLYDLGKRRIATTIEPEWEFFIFRNAGWIGDGPQQLTEMKFRNFIDQASKIKLPVRVGQVAV